MNSAQAEEQRPSVSWISQRQIEELPQGDTYNDDVISCVWWSWGCWPVVVPVQLKASGCLDTKDVAREVVTLLRDSQ